MKGTTSYVYDVLSEEQMEKILKAAAKAASGVRNPRIIARTKLKLKESLEKKAEKM